MTRSSCSKFLRAAPSPPPPPAQGVEVAGEREVSYQAFATFVRSREEALKQAFTMFDTGG